MTDISNQYGHPMQVNHETDYQDNVGDGNAGSVGTGTGRS